MHLRITGFRRMLAVAMCLCALVVCGCPHLESVSVTCTKAQAEMWREFVASMAQKKSPPMALYTRVKCPVKNLSDVTSNEEISVCRFYGDYIAIVMSLLGHEKDDCVGLHCSGGSPETLEDPKLRLYLAFEEWEKKLASIGWVRIVLVAQ